MKIALLSSIAILLAAATAPAAFAQDTQDLAAQVGQLRTDVDQLVQQSKTIEETLQEFQAALAPLAEERKRDERRHALRRSFVARSNRDEKIYKPDEISNAWKIHLEGQNDWGSTKAVSKLKKVISKYPESNLAGCSALYLGQMMTGKEREKYLKMAIEKYSDCFYGDGVQVGALARFHLANYYRRLGENGKAILLTEEMKNKYPEAIDHNGNLIAELSDH